MRVREPEQRMVRNLLRRAQQGIGGVVLVEGEPGIGKSLLLREAMGEAARQGFFVAAAAADQLGQALPFFALRVALGEPFARLTANDPNRDPSAAPGWWINQMCRHLEQRAVATPVLLCLDDLQWASPFTLTALRTLPLELKHSAVAWLLARTSTPQHRTEHLFGLLERDGSPRINLAPLDDDTVTALLTSTFGAPPDQALLGLARGAAGNPALLTELIRGLADEKAVRVTGDRAVLVSTDLPRRLVNIAQRRLDGLSPQGRHLLVTAAVLGPKCRLEDAAEMLGQTPAALLPTVEEAMGTGFLTAADDALSFRHELLRGALGEVIPRPARHALHRQYGHILLHRGESPALAAAHLLEAAHLEDPASLSDLDMAASQILRSSPQTAADLALRALELTPPADPRVLSRSVAATEALTAAGRLDQAERLAYSTLARPLLPVADARIRCALSTVLCARGQADDAAYQAERVVAQPGLPYDLREEALTALMLALGGRQCDGRTGPLADTILAHASQHESHTTVAALTARAVMAWDNGQISESLRLLHDAARHGSAVSPDARHPHPLLALASALVDLRQLQEAASIMSGVGHPALPAIPTQAVVSILRARIHLANGRLADADSAGRAALTHADTLGADGYASTAHCVLGVIALRRGDIFAAEQHIADLPTPIPLPPGLYARAETTLATAQVIEAHAGPAAAISHLRQVGAGLPAGQGLLLGDPCAAPWLVRTALAAGDQRLVARVADAAVALANANLGFLALSVAAAHSQGLALRDPRLLADAAVRHPDPWARASAAEDLAVLLIDTAKDEAIRHLKSAFDGYRHSGADRDQARIRRRLRSVGIRHRHWTTLPARPATGWDSLTDTEQAIARLVAEGLNNKQVASRIYISAHTVAHHLRQAYRKLHIASRVELARIVMEEAPTGS